MNRGEPSPSLRATPSRHPSHLLHMCKSINRSIDQPLTSSQASRHRHVAITYRTTVNPGTHGNYQSLMPSSCRTICHRQKPCLPWLACPHALVVPILRLDARPGRHVVGRNPCEIFNTSLSLIYLVWSRIFIYSKRSR